VFGGRVGGWWGGSYVRFAVWGMGFPVMVGFGDWVFWDRGFWASFPPRVGFRGGGGGCGVCLCFLGFWGGFSGWGYFKFGGGLRWCLGFFVFGGGGWGAGFRVGWCVGLGCFWGFGVWGVGVGFFGLGGGGVLYLFGLRFFLFFFSAECMATCCPLLFPSQVPPSLLLFLSIFGSKTPGPLERLSEDVFHRPFSGNLNSRVSRPPPLCDRRLPISFEDVLARIFPLPAPFVILCWNAFFADVKLSCLPIACTVGSFSLRLSLPVLKSDSYGDRFSFR